MIGACPTDGDEALIARFQQECRAVSQDEVSLCRLMRNPVRRLIDHSAAVIQLLTFRMPTRVIGFDASPRLVRALRLALHAVDSGSLLSKAQEDGPFVLPAERLRAFPLGPGLRPLASGHLALNGHADSDGEFHSAFAFIGVREGDLGRVERILKAITPPLHRVFFHVYQSQNPVVSTLTPAEHAICRLLLEGASNKTIAKVLGKSDATVRNQLHGIFVKLGVSTRTSATAKLHEFHPYLCNRIPGAKRVPIEHLYY